MKATDGKMRLIDRDNIRADKKRKNIDRLKEIVNNWEV